MASILRVGDIELSGKGGLPIGFIYMQLPGQPAPDVIFTGTWTNVSSTYAGEFFRAEGGNAASFGGAGQTDAIRNIVGGTGCHLTRSGLKDAPDGAFYWDSSGSHLYGGVVGNSQTSGIYFDASRVVPTAAENRPVNDTIRIWKRTA